MTKSLARRYKTRLRRECRGAMSISKKELEHGFAYRSKKVCERYYMVGDYRKAIDRKDGCSLSAKVDITKIAYDKKARKTKISFDVIREVIRYVEVDWRD